MLPTFKDIRYHSFYLQFPHNLYNHSIEFDKFPYGSSEFYSIEKYVWKNFAAIIRLSNSHWHYSIYISLIYLSMIIILKSIMLHQSNGFKLKWQLFVWNIFLATFSLIGTTRCLPEFVHILINDGFIDSYTKNTYGKDIRLNAWYLFFTLSKALELIDTLFIVLRKRRLIKLHWIHHTLTLIYSWFVFGDIPSTARWMVNMNFIIHTFMYSYYAITTIGYRLPIQANILLTTLQIVQMLFGLYINIDCLRLKLLSKPCDVSLPVAITGFTLYSLFFIMFMEFFLNTYVFRKKIIQKNINNNDIINNNCKMASNNSTATTTLSNRLTSSISINYQFNDHNDNHRYDKDNLIIESISSNNNNNNHNGKLMKKIN